MTVFIIELLPRACRRCLPNEFIIDARQYGRISRLQVASIRGGREEALSAGSPPSGSEVRGCSWGVYMVYKYPTFNYLQIHQVNLDSCEACPLRDRRPWETPSSFFLFLKPTNAPTNAFLVSIDRLHDDNETLNFNTI